MNAVRRQIHYFLQNVQAYEQTTLKCMQRSMLYMDEYRLYTLHAFGLLAPYACHAKQRGFFFDHHTSEAPDLVCQVVHCQGMVHLLPDSFPIRDVQRHLVQAAPQGSITALCLHMLRCSPGHSLHSSLPHT